MKKKEKEKTAGYILFDGSGFFVMTIERRKKKGDKNENDKLCNM
ncbi:MAG TPA: hypothetical protein P5140_05720 [Methanofastidiosum sp.]|nr:hypothetical protein [Methanofastidiosum sp.]